MPQILPLSPALSVLVALVAINAVVDISRYLIVLEVVRVVSAMTSSALEHRIVIGVRVAGRADSARIAVSDGERRVLRVVKRRPRPCCGVVTRLASGWEKLRLRRVTGVRGVVVIRLMAPDARRRQRREVVVDVAIGTLPRRHRVRTGQGERRVVVVKRGIGPYGRVVTKFTGGRETSGRVGWIVRSGIIRLVARVTQSAIQRIVVVLVAITAQARRHRMRTGQGESSGGVVESSIRPGDGVVARGTGRWEAAVRHRTSRGLVVGLMAAVTSGRQRREVVVGMAVRASSRRHHM